MTQHLIQSVVELCLNHLHSSRDITAAIPDIFNKEERNAISQEEKRSRVMAAQVVPVVSKINTTTETSAPHLIKMAKKWKASGKASRESSYGSRSQACSGAGFQL